MIAPSPAYLAGVLDSDGSLSISRSHVKRKHVAYVPVFQLTWKLKKGVREIMDYLISKYGGNYFYYEAKKTYGTKTNCLKYGLSSKKLKQFLLDIKPYVILKQDQLKNCLVIIEMNARNQGRRRSSEDTIIYESLHKFNRQSNDKNKSRSENEKR